jgi:DNA-binding MarR family transcriptional regulator
MSIPLEKLFALIDVRLSAASSVTRQKLLSSTELSELTGTHIYYLHTIHELEKATITELAKQLNVTKPSVTGITGKLIQMGYLEKTPSGKDLRIYHLQLTPKGQRVVQIKSETFLSFANQVRSHLAPHEVAELELLLAKALQA